MTSQTIHPEPYVTGETATVGAVLRAYAAVAPDAVFVVDEQRSVSVAEVAQLAETLRRSLAAAGVQQGDPVGVLMANGWRWVVTYLALMSSGFIAVPMNTWYKEAELRSAGAKTGMRAVISQSVLHGRDNEALLAGAGLLEPQDDYLGTFLWNADYPERLDPKAPEPSGFEPTKESDTAAYCFTSGSSAEPKVVVLQHGGLVENGWAMGSRMNVQPGEPVWFAAPLFFGFGCANAISVSLTHGLQLCVEERFEPFKSAEFLMKHKCAVFYGLGPMIRQLAQPEVRATLNLSWEVKGCIGVTAEDKRVAVEELGITGARSCYGLTECYGLGVMTEEGDDPEAVITTQGRPVDGHELRIVDPATGRDVESDNPDALGEIWLRGRVTPGYLDNDKANAQAFTEDGWFRTGDLGWVDGEGRLHFAGRLKEVVKINGITISPAEVEDFVTEHPDVSEAYAFGWPAAVNGEEELWCAVVLRDDAGLGADRADEQLRAWLRGRISSYKVPSHFLVIADGKVPMTATGKVSKRLIGEQFITSAKEAGA